MVKPQFELGPRKGVARAAWSAIPPTGARRCGVVAAEARELGVSVAGFASSGLPGPRGNRETFVHAGRGGRRARCADLRGGAAEVEPS